MNSNITTVAELLHDCLKKMLDNDTDTLLLDLNADEHVFAFEIKLLTVDGESATEVTE